MHSRPQIKLNILALSLLCWTATTLACASTPPDAAKARSMIHVSATTSRSAIPTLSLEQPLERLIFQELQRIQAPQERAQAYMSLAQVMFKRREFAQVQRTLRYAKWDLREDATIVAQLDQTLATLTQARGQQRVKDALSCGLPAWCRRLDALDDKLKLRDLNATIKTQLAPPAHEYIAQLEHTTDQATRDALLAQWEAQLEVAFNHEPERLVRAHLERLRRLDSLKAPPTVSAPQLERLATLAAQIKQRERREGALRELGYYGLSHDLGAWVWVLTQKRLKQRSRENARLELEAAIHTARWHEALTLATTLSPTSDQLEPIERTIDALIASGQLELAARAIDTMPRVARWRAQLIHLASAAHEAKAPQLAAAHLSRLEEAIKEEEQDLEPDEAGPIAHGVELAQAYNVTGQLAQARQRWERVEQRLNQSIDVEDVIAPWLELLEVQHTITPTRALQTSALLMQRLTSSQAAIDLSLDERALSALQGSPQLLTWAPQLIGAMWPLWDNISAPQYIAWLRTRWAGLHPAQQKALLEHHLESQRPPLEQDQLIIALMGPCAQSSCLDTLITYLSSRELNQSHAAEVVAQLLGAKTPLQTIIAATSTFQSTSKQQALVALLDSRPQALKKLSGRAWALELQSARGISARRLRRALIRAALNQADCALAIDLITNSSLGPAGPFTWQESKACLQEPAQRMAYAPALAQALSAQERVTLYLALLKDTSPQDEQQLARALPDPSALP